MATDNTQTLAIVGLVINAIFLPGLGSIIGGRTRTGIIQLVVLAVGFVLSFVLIGIPIVFGVWVWGIVTGIQMLKETGTV